MTQLPTRHSIVISLISIGLGVIIGYLLHGDTTFESIKNWIIAGVSFAVVANMVFDWLKWKREEKIKQREKSEKEKAERRKELEEFLREHSNNLVNDVLKEWLSFRPERRLRDTHYVSARTPLAEAHYEPHSKSRIENSIKLYSLKYKDQGIEHFNAIEYTRIWNLWLECEKHTKNYLDENVKIWGSIEEKVTTRIPANFVEWNGLGTIPPTCCVLDQTVLAIYQDVKHFMIKGELWETFKKIPEPSSFKVGTGSLYAKSSDENLIDEFIKIVSDIVTDKSLIEQLKLLDAEEKKIEGMVEKFKQELDSIVEDFEKGHINLKGTCRRCKPWADELASLNENAKIARSEHF